MKYQNLGAFKKHLSSAAPDHLCRSYLIAIHDDFEREAALKSLLSFLPKESRITLNGGETSCKDIAEALLSPSLFGGEPVVILEEGEKLGKKEQETLKDCVQLSLKSGYLLCSAKSKVSFLSLFEKAGVVLDLLEEKPWEKEKRLAEEIYFQVSSAQKRIAPDAVQLLLEKLGTQSAAIHSEIQKLLCFVGEKKTIERLDVLQIVAGEKEEVVWKIAEGFVWDRKMQEIEATSFHALLPSFRSELQVGLKICDLIEHQIPKEKWGAFLPRLWPKLLEKRTSQAEKLGRDYFRKGLDFLFEIELLSRSGTSREEALLDLFQYSLCNLVN